jgi:hypothetical protein
VEHNVTLPTQFFPDDICGLRASFETATYKTMITKITEDANGGFHVVDFETGSIAVDYVDPVLKDTTFRITNTFHFNLTPGGTETVTETLRQSDGELFIRYQYHLTVVRGEPKVEREVQLAPGCPCWVPAGRPPVAISRSS